MIRRALLSLLAAASIVACSPPAPPAPAAASASSTSAPVGEELDRIDERTPLPLSPMMANHQKQNMREHLVAVQEMVAGLSTGDFAAVEKAASRIGYSEGMGQMCTHMGAAAPGFTDQALSFHRAADRIAAAARDGDQARVLAELGETLRACTGCHAAWKQRIVDDETLARLTAAAADGETNVSHSP